MSFTPSQYELALVTRILAKAGLEELRILTVEAALEVFESTKLSRALLSEILSLADDNNDGILPENGVATAVRLVGWAQIGEQVTKELINKREHACLHPSHIINNAASPAGPLPIIEGIGSLFLNQNTENTSASPVLPEFTPQDHAHYMKIFQSCNPKDGLITGACR